MQEQLPRGVLEETTRKYSRRVLGGTPNILRIPNWILQDQCQLKAATRVPAL